MNNWKLNNDSELADRLDQLAEAMRWNQRLGDPTYDSDTQRMLKETAFRLRDRKNEVV